MPDWPIRWVQVKIEAGPGEPATSSWLEICNTGGRTLDFTLHPAEKGDPMAKLLVQEGNGAREFELVDLEINIGRELDNTLRLPDPSISRHHAVIRLGPAGYEIQDLQSSNGVLLNGSKVASAPLRDGDRITLGQMQLTFVDPKTAGADSNPLGTVRMDPEAMARIWAGAAPPPVPDPPPPAAGAPPGRVEEGTVVTTIQGPRRPRGPSDAAQLRARSRTSAVRWRSRPSATAASL